MDNYFEIDLDELEPDVVEFFRDIDLESEEEILEFLTLISGIQNVSPEEVLLTIIDQLDEENTDEEVHSEYLEELRRIAEE